MGIKQGLAAALLGMVFLGRPAPAVFGQERESRDLILVLDASAAMSAYYREINRYLSGPFLHANLRLGDTFHLIAFSDRARMEIARRIEGRGDLETIIGRLLLMYPLEPPADLPAALSFAERYVRDLDSRRQKKMILLSLGNEGEAASPEAQAVETRRRLAGRNTSLEYIDPRTLPKAPARTAPPPATEATPSQATAPASGQAAQRPATAATPSQATAAPGQAAQRPAAAATTPSQATAPASGQAAQRPATAATPSQATAAPGQATAPATGQAAQRPAAAATPSQTTAPATGQRAQRPATATTSGQTEERASGSIRAGFRNLRRALLDHYKLPAGLLILTVLGLGIFFLARRLHRSPNRAAARAAAGGASGGQTSQKAPPAESAGARQIRAPRKSPYRDTYRAPKKIEYGAPLMLRLFVADQNTFVGKRNTHLVKPGSSYTVGGGRSDFLIFLVRIPPRIGELRYENSSCSFYPRKPEYFPDIGAGPVRDCIGKTIRVISDKGYELFIRIEQYEDPLIELNRLMHSIKIPSALDV
jgi:hypothetical protein